LQQENTKRIREILAEKYPLPSTALKFDTPFQLLVATILSAQSTDSQVNKVTSDLFDRYSSPEEFASLNRETLEEEIRSIGLFRNKSRFIIEASRRIIEDFSGKVPADFDKLLELPGVGRKTASVVMYAAFSRPAFPVDTHVFRVSNRLGLADSDNRDEVERQLRDKIPEDEWGDMHLRLIYHGRETCKARNPRCEKCSLRKYCDYYSNLKREGDMDEF